MFETKDGMLCPYVLVSTIFLSWAQILQKTSSILTHLLNWLKKRSARNKFYKFIYVK